MRFEEQLAPSHVPVSGPVLVGVGTCRLVLVGALRRFGCCF